MGAFFVWKRTWRGLDLGEKREGRRDALVVPTTILRYVRTYKDAHTHSNLRSWHTSGSRDISFFPSVLLCPFEGLFSLPAFPCFF